MLDVVLILFSELSLRINSGEWLNKASSILHFASSLLLCAFNFFKHFFKLFHTQLIITQKLRHQ